MLSSGNIQLMRSNTATKVEDFLTVERNADNVRPSLDAHGLGNI